MREAHDELHLTLEDDPSAETIATLRSGIDAYNAEKIGADDTRKLAILARDATGAICGGLYGESYWGWLFIEFLWVAPSRRASGVGARLLQQAEREATLRGCTGVYLNTISFQA